MLKNKNEPGFVTVFGQWLFRSLGCRPYDCRSVTIDYFQIGLREFYFTLPRLLTEAILNIWSEE